MCFSDRLQDEDEDKDEVIAPGTSIQLQSNSAPMLVTKNSDASKPLVEETKQEQKMVSQIPSDISMRPNSTDTAPEEWNNLIKRCA